MILNVSSYKDIQNENHFTVLKQGLDMIFII